MTLAYSADGTSSTNIVGTKYTALRYVTTIDLTRAFQRFDLSSYGISVSDVTSVVLYCNFYSVTVGSNVRCRTSISTDGDDWGTSLNANATEWDSTKTFDHGIVAVTSTGWKSWTLDKTAIDFSGVTWVRLVSQAENNSTTRIMRFYSEDETTTTNRPYLRITYTPPVAGGAEQVIMVMAS